MEFIFLLNNTFILTEQEADKFSRSSTFTPPLPSAIAYNKLRDLNLVSRYTRTYLGLNYKARSADSTENIKEKSELFCIYY